MIKIIIKMKTSKRETLSGKYENRLQSWMSRNRNDIRFKQAISLAKRSRDDLASGGSGGVHGFLNVTSHKVVHGQGVVSERSFAKDTAIIVGIGKAVSMCDSGEGGTYSFEMDSAGPKYKGMDLDFSTTGRNLVAFINSAYRPSATPCDEKENTRNRSLVPNVKLLWTGPALVVYAKRRIRRGDELLADYTYALKI